MALSVPIGVIRGLHELKTSIMPKIARIVLAAWLLLSFSRPLFAEAVTASGIIEAVNVEAGTITVRRKTAGGEKTATLKLGPSARILRGEQAIELSSLAKGETVNLTYDTVAKQVTAIAAEPRNAPRTDDPQRDANCVFFILRVSETGDCVAELTREAAPPAQGQPSQIASLPRAEIVKTKTGLFSVRHDFAKCDLTAFRETRSVSVRNNRLTFELPTKEGAMLPYPNAWRLPLEINLAVADFGANTLIVSISSGNGALLHLNWSSDCGSGAGLRSRCFLDAGWREGEGAARRTRQLVDHVAVNTSYFKRMFRLPYPNEPIEDRFFVAIGVKGGTPLTAKSLTITGRPVPFFGIALEARGDTVFASQVVARSPAESAGVRAGDVVLSINGKSPGSVKEAMSLLGDTAFGETATLTIRRAGVEKTISVKAD